MRFFQAAAFAAALFCASAHADDAPTDCDGCRDHALRTRVSRRPAGRRGMSATRWQRVASIFDGVAKLPPERQAETLARTRGPMHWMTQRLNRAARPVS